MAKRTKRGRPLAGRDERGNAVPVRDYPQTTVRLPPHSRLFLDAVADLEKRSLSQILDDALGLYREGMPADARRAAEAIVERHLSAKRVRERYLAKRRSA